MRKVNLWMLQQSLAPQPFGPISKGPFTFHRMSSTIHSSENSPLPHQYVRNLPDFEQILIFSSDKLQHSLLIKWNRCIVQKLTQLEVYRYSSCECNNHWLEMSVVKTYYTSKSCQTRSFHFKKWSRAPVSVTESTSYYNTQQLEHSRDTLCYHIHKLALNT